MSLELSQDRLAKLAGALADADAIPEVCRALRSGRLRQDSASPIREALAQGKPRIEQSIKEVQEHWRRALASTNADSLALALETAASAAALERFRSPQTQVVWTGPQVEGSHLRATREVVREIVRGARRELVIVGYWIATREDGEGIISELIALLSEAVGRGVAVTMVLDERQRADGNDNRKVLLEIWPSATPVPRLLTWLLPADDRHLKLHAKVMLADDQDALVTSANLTWYAMDRNMEMGVRIQGEPASIIGQHLRLLAQQGVLQPF